MVSALQNFAKSYLPENPLVLRNYATKGAVFSAGCALLGIYLGSIRSSFFAGCATMLTYQLYKFRNSISISFSTKVEYFQKKLINADVKGIVTNLAELKKECCKLGKEYEELTPKEQENPYLQDAFETMIALLHPETVNRSAHLEKLKSIQPNRAVAPIQTTTKAADIDADIHVSPRIDDPFLAWLKKNRHLSNGKKSLIKSAYEKAINSSNPERTFQDRIRELDNNTLLDPADIGYCLTEFEKARVKPRPLLRSRSFPIAEFNPGNWSSDFRAIPRTLDPKTLRARKGALLKIIREGTLDVLKTRKYRVRGNTVPLSSVLTKKMKEGTTLYSKAPPLIIGERFEDIKIQVIDSDVIDAAVLAQQKGYRSPVFINMARADKPCGSFMEDSPAGEENNSRRSTLWQSLSLEHNPDFYKRSNMQKGYLIPRGGAILTPHLEVFRGNEASGYPFLEDPIELACISIAAPDLNPHHGKLPCKPNSQEHADWLDRTIETYLSVAYNNGHDALVLSALGCGAYENDPKFVASRFARILGQPKWRGKFGSVCFAILGKGKNLDAFNVLNGQVLGKPNSSIR